MPAEILTSIEGRRLGVTPRGGLALNQPGNRGQHLIGETVAVTVPAASVLALNATPVTIIPAQGANIAVIPLMWNVFKASGTAYGGIAAGEDLVLKYTNGAGEQCSSVIETTGFLDQTTGQQRHAFAPASTGATAGSFTPVANAAVVLHLLSGEITTGDSSLQVRVWYTTIYTPIWLD